MRDFSKKRSSIIKEEVLLGDLSKKHALNLLILYTYSLSKQPKSKAVRFVYLLKGRAKEPGIIKQFKGRFLAPGCFIIPSKKDKEMQQIFTLWKIPFKKISILTH